MKRTDKDKVLVVAAGITLAEAITAAGELAKSGLNIRILDPFTIKPIDKAAIVENAKECGGRVIIVEDHYPEGGLGEAVFSVLISERISVVGKIMAVPRVPRSGPSAALLDHYGISSKHIIDAVKDIVKD